MKNQFKILILALVFIIFVIIFYSALGTNNKNNTQVMVSKKLPRIELTSLYEEEKKISFPKINHKDYYIINIWASWCVPCRDEHPFLMKLANENKVKIYGINYKDSKMNALTFLKELGNPFYDIGIDSNGQNSIELGAYGVPETYLIDNKGIIILKHVGPINKDIYQKILDKIKS